MVQEHCFGEAPLRDVSKQRILQAMHQMFTVPQTYYTVETNFIELPLRIIVAENKFGEVIKTSYKTSIMVKHINI